MFVVSRRAVPVAAFVACAVAASPAGAQQGTDVLVAQIAQVAPTPGSEPVLTRKPPVPLGTPTPTPTPTPSPAATSTSVPTTTPTAAGEHLPDTGADAGLVALAGISLLGMGVGVRAAALDASPR